jgi:hypothetical protein
MWLAKYLPECSEVGAFAAYVDGGPPLLGVTTKKKETVNTALRDYVARIKQLEAAEKLAARGARGEYEQAAAAHDAEKRARRETFE